VVQIAIPTQLLLFATWFVIFHFGDFGEYFCFVL